MEEKERDGNGWDEVEKGKRGVTDPGKLGELSRSNWQEKKMRCRCLWIEGGSLFWCEQGRQS